MKNGNKLYILQEIFSYHVGTQQVKNAIMHIIHIFRQYKYKNEQQKIKLNKLENIIQSYI